MSPVGRPLCDNCLGDNGGGVPVGYPTGSQRDPVQGHVTLCPDCKSALLEGDFGRLSGRFAVSRTITRHYPNE